MGLFLYGLSQILSDPTQINKQAKKQHLREINMASLFPVLLPSNKIMDANIKIFVILFVFFTLTNLFFFLLISFEGH